MKLIQYILASSACVSLFYIVYRMLFSRTTSFHHARFFILASIILSLLIPLSGYQIETGIRWPLNQREKSYISNPPDYAYKAGPAEITTNFQFKPEHILPVIYFGVTAILILRILLLLTVLFYKYHRALKVHQTDCTLLYDPRFTSTFSFFNWIFVRNSGSDQDIQQIIAHEKIHVKQLHSFDIMMIELLTAVMWFNPLIWMMKGTIQLVHEYLADKGALQSGIDKSLYQALLINQVAEERLIGLSSSFNQLLIKKRILMMTKTKKQADSIVRLLAVMPVSVMLFTIIAVINGITSQEVRGSAGSELLLLNNGSITPANYEPPDTIVKRTIIKKVSKENPTDTIVEESEKIIIREGMNEPHMTGHSRMVRHHTTDEPTEVIVHQNEKGDHMVTRTYTIHINEDEDVHEIITGDSVKTVTVIRKQHKPSSDKVDQHALYIVDGVVYKGLFEEINPEDLESVDVIKEPSKMKKYTDDPYDAVIVIRTKKGNN